MKKSTLITTIAMIVVVVVALSTATYAWFSSTATATASASFSTTATGDWSMIQGTVALKAKAANGLTGNADVTFNTAAADTITYTNTLNNNLWAPYSEINATFDGAGSAPVASGLVGFVNCLKDSTGNKVTRKFDGVTGGTTSQAYGTTVLTDEALAKGGFIAPLAIRMINVSGQTKTLQMNVTINAGSSGTNNSMYAGAAIRFYIYEVSSAASSNTATYTSGYKVAGDCTDKAIDAECGSYANTNAQADTAEVSNNTGVTLLDYTTGAIEGLYTKALTDNPTLGIVTNDWVKTYTFSMQEYAPNAYSNILIYCWVDGYVANASAGNAQFSVVFGFNSVA